MILNTTKENAMSKPAPHPPKIKKIDMVSSLPCDFDLHSIMQISADIEFVLKGAAECLGE